VPKDRDQLATRWHEFDESVFSQITQAANRSGAINLAQGFPDFPGPQRLLSAVSAVSTAVMGCPNQYAPTGGLAVAQEAVSGFVSHMLDMNWCSEGVPNCMITAGATEAVFCLVAGIVNPGDRVLCFEPFYESYRQAVATAGGQFLGVRLLPPGGEDQDSWSIDWDELLAATSMPFRCMIINTPHNPTGMTLTQEQLELILDQCRRYGASLISDEVYEQVYFETRPVSLLNVATTKDSFARVSSVAKSFGFTGFKVGWIHGSPALIRAAMKVHEAVMFCVPMALQLGVAKYLESLVEVEEDLMRQRLMFRERRDRLLEGLRAIGFGACQAPQGAYFLTVNADSMIHKGERDWDFSRRMLLDGGVAAIPISAFCRPQLGTLVKVRRQWDQMGWIRFAFCKSDLVIDGAIASLSKWQSSAKLESQA
jgi:N-succinyldiaminopimelate aminotransferase